MPHEENSAGMATRREEMRRVPVGGGGLGAPGGVRRDGTLRAAHCLSARDWLAGVRGVVVPATESRCHVRGARRSADRQRASHRRTRRQMLRKQMLLRSPATGAGGYPHRRRPSSSARRLRRGRRVPLLRVRRSGPGQRRVILGLRTGAFTHGRVSMCRAGGEERRRALHVAWASGVPRRRLGGRSSGGGVGQVNDWACQ